MIRKIFIHDWMTARDNNMTKAMMRLLLAERAKLLPFEYNRFYFELMEHILCRLYKVQKEPIITNDMMLLLRSLPGYTESSETPRCNKCPIIVENQLTFNFKENE